MVGVPLASVSSSAIFTLIIFSRNLSIGSDTVGRRLVDASARHEARPRRRRVFRRPSKTLGDIHPAIGRITGNTQARIPDIPHLRDDLAELDCAMAVLAVVGL